MSDDYYGDKAVARYNDVLEALEYAAAVITTAAEMAEMEGMRNMPGILRDEAAKARAVIAKAKGEG